MATIKQRVHRMNESGTYDTIHYETSSSCVLLSNGSYLSDYENYVTGNSVASHNQSASTITSGTLGLARGGTNATSGAAAIYQLTNPASALASTGLASGDYLPVLDTSASTGKKVTLANLTAYLKATGEVGGISNYTEKSTSVSTGTNSNGAYYRYNITDVKMIVAIQYSSSEKFLSSIIMERNGTTLTSKLFYTHSGAASSAENILDEAYSDGFKYLQISGNNLDLYYRHKTSNGSWTFTRYDDFMFLG